METTTTVPQGLASYHGENHGENSTRPIRILVQTKTHLVPGNDYHDRVRFMLDLICQHHWNCNFVLKQHRWSTYGCRFGYENRRCYFLLDYGESPNDDDVPVLWYEWMGGSLTALSKSLPLKVQTVLKDYPFTRPSVQDLPKSAPIDAATRRQNIRMKLRSEMILSDPDFEFIKENPEEASWLKDHIATRFWLKFESLAKAYEMAKDKSLKGLDNAEVDT